MSHATNFHKAWRPLFAALLLIAGLLGPAAGQATQVSTLGLNETVRQADAIVVGTITGKQVRWGDSSQRWMETDFFLAVDDVIHPSEQAVPIQGTITLTYWGGTIGDETQAISDIRLPRAGERLLVMLHPRWVQRGNMAPTVGFNQGLFLVAPDASGKPMVRNAAGQLLAMEAVGNAANGSTDTQHASGAIDVDLAKFTDWLRTNIAAIKAAPPAPRVSANPNDPRVMKVFAKDPAPIQRPAPLAASARTDSVVPRQGPKVEAAAGMPVVPSSAGAAQPAASPAEQAQSSHDGITPHYSSAHQAHLPIVVNSLPHSFTPWYPDDEYQLSKWNYYADVFRVYTTPTGTYNWPDGVFDMAGWPSDADMVRVYGFGWFCGAGCTTLGVTPLRYDGNGWIIEADNALNPAVSWTLDDEWVFDGSTAKSYRQTMIHELGHMHGLEHNFNFLALMNYMQPSRYRHYALPFMDDAAGIRAEYPANAIAVSDLAVYLFRESGSCYDGTNFITCIYEATFPQSVFAGANLSVNDYHVENTGTATIATPTIEWYLTSARTFNSAYYYLGTSTYGSLSPFSYFTTSSVQRTFRVSANVAPGYYYLAAYIRNDGGAYQSSFPFSNNYAFSYTQVHVLAPPPLTLQSVASRKTHGSAGTFNLSLNALATNPTTEPRSGGTGGNHTIVFTFDRPPSSGSAAVTAGLATVGPPTFSGNEMRVPLSGVTDRQYVTVTASSVIAADGGTGSGTRRIGFLVGDVNQSRSVSLADLALVDAQLAQPVTASNYLKDINASGTMTLSDKGGTNASLTHSLPAP